MASRAFRVLLLPVAIAAWCAACTSQALDVQPAAPQRAYRSEDVRVLDDAGFKQLRGAGTHDIRGPLGEITAAAACSSGTVDEQCYEAVRQRLREEAASRGANLVVIVRSAVAQSFPPRYSAAGELYEISERR